MNTGCRLIFNLKKSDHLTIHLMELHWLKIEERIDFKVLLIVYKALNGLAPCYLADLLSKPCKGNLRLDSSLKLFQPRPSSSKMLHGSFAVKGTCLWNSLPMHIRCSATVVVFKCRVKTFLFTKSYN